MADRSSRHRRGKTYRRQVGDREVELLEPRAIPLSLVAAQHRVGGDDRLDLLAHRYYSDPHQYWRIADANPSDSPEDLLEPGRVLLIPEAD
jgi:nucleoid-associated protein YgaU